MNDNLKATLTYILEHLVWAEMLSHEHLKELYLPTVLDEQKLDKGWCFYQERSVH